MIYPIAAALVVDGSLMSVLVSSFLQLMPCLFLGRISFSMYLIYVPVAYTLVMAVAVLLWPMAPITLGIGLLIFIALSVSLGWLSRGGPGCLNRFSASISGASAGVRLPSGVAAV